ncbi:MAG: pyruvate synthase subunit beta [Candidatus Lokiarchaeota archaeon]|nr:pyruvate synthase subunit beta [Candidatus Lokiarchaeota archaeon]
MSRKLTVADLPEEEYILPGTRACSGCGLSLAYRYALKALGKNTIVTVPASCSTVLHGMYPCAAVNIPMLNTAFESTGASASGIRAGLNALGKKDITVLAWAGDGGTTDIGIQALSGAAERGTDIIYACYDNQAYMNTGTQRSGSTPLGAYTTTTPTGKAQRRKNMPAIMAAHGIPYVASTNASYPIDVYTKFKKANNEFKGDTRYIHIFSPCPPGWGFDTKDLIKIGKLATLSGIWDLYEIINGDLQLNGDTLKIVQGKKKRLPVKEYFRSQKRFDVLSDEQIQSIQKEIDNKFEDYKTTFEC